MFRDLSYSPQVRTPTDPIIGIHTGRTKVGSLWHDRQRRHGRRTTDFDRSPGRSHLEFTEASPP